MEIQNSLGSVQAQFAVGMHTKAQDTTANLVNKLMADSLAGTTAANQSLAARGVGTNLNITV